MNLIAIKEVDVFKVLENRGFLFISTISFEERCTNICQHLIRNSLSPKRSLLYHYMTKADPTNLDLNLRNDHIKLFHKLLKEENITSINKINPYSTSLLRDNLIKILNSNSINQVVIDISCMTKAHILSLASILAQIPLENREFYFSYTAAESYDIESERGSGWIDSLLLPIGFPRSLRREGHARGIVLVGHDPERLSLALSELEPAAGCIIYANTYKRTDLMCYAREVNMYLHKYLLSLGMPHRSSLDDDISYTWKEETIMIDDYEPLKNIIEEQVQFAKKDEGPIVLYPFGPKNLVFFTGFILSNFKDVNSWAAYPIPYRYSIDYSQGSACTYWMKINI